MDWKEESKEDREHVLRFERRQWLIFKEELEFEEDFPSFEKRPFSGQRIHEIIYSMDWKEESKVVWEHVLRFERRQRLVFKEELKFWGMFSVFRDAAVLWTMDSRGTMFGELERGVKEDWEHVLRFERRQWLIFREVLEFWGRFFVRRDIRDTMFDGLERKVKEDWEFVLWFERRQWLIRREELDKFWGRLIRLILTLSSVNTLSV